MAARRCYQVREVGKGVTVIATSDNGSDYRLTFFHFSQLRSPAMPSIALGRDKFPTMLP